MMLGQVWYDCRVICGWIPDEFCMIVGVFLLFFVVFMSLALVLDDFGMI